MTRPKGKRGAPKGSRNAAAANRRKNHTKQCTCCGDVKPLTEFHVEKKSMYGVQLRASDPRRYASQCKLCRKNEAAPMPRKKLAKKRKAFDQSAQKKRVRKETRIKLFEYLAAKGCCDCGIRDPRVLEFDHIDPTEKKHTIANLISWGYSWASKTLREELLKCRIICANCHRIHTKEQQSYYAEPEVAGKLSEILAEHGIDE